MHNGAAATSVLTKPSTTQDRQVSAERHFSLALPRRFLAAIPPCCAGATCSTGPGFATPLDAFRNGERETLAYVPVTIAGHERPDYLATVDLNTSKVRRRSSRRVALPSSSRGARCAGHRAPADAAQGRRASPFRVERVQLVLRRPGQVTVAPHPPGAVLRTHLWCERAGLLLRPRGVRSLLGRLLRLRVARSVSARGVSALDGRASWRAWLGA